MIWTFLKHLFRLRCQRITLFGRTDTGRCRTNNEDSFTIMPQANLMMVADGMGGHNAGEVASRVAIETMTSLLGQGSLHRAGNNQVEICHLMIHAMRQTNDRVMAMAVDTPEYSGMGSTLITGFISHGVLCTCHVGDVRAYLLHENKMRQLTQDHTYAAEFSRSHENDPDFDSTSLSISRNIVSRAIGFPFNDDPECTITPVHDGDRILLCSDGLWSMVSDQELSGILCGAATPEEACDRFITAANQAGGKDNITAVVAFV